MNAMANVLALPAPSTNTLAELQTAIHREVRSSGRPVRQLSAWLLDRRNLHAAWERVAEAEGASTPGPDGIVCNQIRGELDAWIARLADDLFHRRYRPQPPRIVEVPKANKPGAVRRLGILNVRDRVVHTALKQVLEPVLEPVFLDSSYGFRPGRSVAAALHDAVGCLEAEDAKPLPLAYAVQLDVADCFDTIDHALLRGELARHVADPGVSTLLDGILTAGGVRCGRLWWQRTCGLTQGSSLSPMLCNLALHPLDVTLHDLAASTQNGVRALRYADDLLLLARDAKLADRALALTRQVLGRLQQQLRSPVATPRPILDGVEWLGVHIQPRPHRWTGWVTFGHAIPDAKVRDMIARLTEMTQPPNDRIAGAAFNAAKWIVSINDQLRDWRAAYLYADNAPDVFRALDEHTRDRVGRLLRSILGLSPYQLLRQHRVRLPRGFWTWEVPGARLSVLSSLAPHAPSNLVRRPVWMERRPGKPTTAQPLPQAIPLEAPKPKSARS